MNIEGGAFWNHSADYMQSLGLFPYPDEIYIWMKPMVILYGRFNYYAYVLIYVNDVMVIHHDEDSVIRRIYKYLSSIPVQLVTLTFILGTTELK